MKRPCFVVGGGSSLKNFDFSLLANQDSIVTNKAIFDTPNPKYFITVDYTFLRKIDLKKFKSIKTTKIFVAGFHHFYIRESRGQIVDTRYNLVYDLSPFNIIIKSNKAEGIGPSFDEFRTGLNSGYCALQLAIILGYKEIVLLGIDLNITKNTTHYHNGYKGSAVSFERKLEEYYHYFQDGLRQIELGYPDIKVISCSLESRLNGIIPYISIAEILG